MPRMAWCQLTWHAVAAEMVLDEGAGQAEAEIAAHEVRAAAVARPAAGIRTLLQGPAQVTIIGNVCPAAISTYLARLYPRERDRVRLVIARHGADPAILEPTPIPVL